MAPNSAAGELPSDGFIRRWHYPDIEAMARQLPYPVYGSIYLQAIDKSSREAPAGDPLAAIAPEVAPGAAPAYRFPAQAISIEVPPSTHFGYTIEWILLATATLALGFGYQAFPAVFRRRG